MVIDGDVYDLTMFVSVHPGGAGPLVEAAGTDATALFFGLHRGSVLDDPKYAKLKVGTLVTVKSAPGDGTNTLMPYAEAHGFWRKHSPYYRQSHHEFRAAVRAFVDAEIRPTSIDDDAKGIAPSLELNVKMGQAGILSAIVTSAPVVQSLGFTALPGGEYTVSPTVLARTHTHTH